MVSCIATTMKVFVLFVALIGLVALALHHIDTFYETSYSEPVKEYLRVLSPSYEAVVNFVSLSLTAVEEATLAFKVTVERKWGDLQSNYL